MTTPTILCGDCLEVMRGMPDQSIHCCVTSPPYWGLRDYGHADQIGLEKTPDEYVQRLVMVFCEVRRLLRDDGTLWLNLGDSYASSGKSGKQSDTSKLGRGCDGTIRMAGGKVGPNPKMVGQVFGRAPTPDGLKPKDLVGIPWRVAFALQADGWYLRQDIIWHKPNPMPESVTDRCTKAHEYVFLLSKSAGYYYDGDAIKEAACKGYAGSSFTTGKTAIHQQMRSSTAERAEADTRNRRSVWTVATQPYSGAHFATMPPKLARDCILAGCPVGGTVLDPFGGSGTTAEQAIGHARHAVSIELSPEYIKLQEQRLNGAQIGLPLGALA